MISVQATTDQDIACLLQALPQRLRALRRQDVLHERQGNGFIAVDAGDLFNQIRRNRHVQTMARHLHLQTRALRRPYVRVQVNARADRMRCMSLR